MTDRAIRIDSRFNRIAAVIVWSLAALAVITAVWSADPRLAWVYAAAPLAALLGWMALWRASVESVCASCGIPSPTMDKLAAEGLRDRPA